MKGFKRLVSFLMAVVLIVGVFGTKPNGSVNAAEMSPLADLLLSSGFGSEHNWYESSDDNIIICIEASFAYASLSFYDEFPEDLEGAYAVISDNGQVLMQSVFDLEAYGIGEDENGEYYICYADFYNINEFIPEPGEYDLDCYDSEGRLIDSYTITFKAVEQVSSTSNHVSSWVDLVNSVQLVEKQSEYMQFIIWSDGEGDTSVYYKYSYMIFNADTGELLLTTPEIIECLSFMPSFYPEMVGRTTFDLSQNYLFVFLDDAQNIFAYGYTNGEVDSFTENDNIEGIYNQYIAPLSEDDIAPDYIIPDIFEGEPFDREAVEDFVTRNYELVLGRTPDETGLNNWVNSIVTYRNTGAHVAYGFFFSQEYQNMNVTNEEFVTTLYKVFLNRELDANGMADWVGQLEAGATREQVFAGVANSREFFNLCVGYGITAGHYVQGVDNTRQQNINAFVTRLYSIVLARIGDYSGQEDWVRQLVNNQNTGAGVAYGFFFSPEIASFYERNPEYYVLDLYRVMLGRMPDQAGFNNWVDQLYNGADLMSIFRGFAHSQEYTNICNNYGITRGTV